MQSECDGLRSGYACAHESMFEPSGQAPQPALGPVPQTPRRRWGFRGWIKSSARSVKNLFPGFNLLSPVLEQSPTESKASLPAAPVSLNVKNARRHRSKNLSSRPKKSFRTKEVLEQKIEPHRRSWKVMEIHRT